jgi:hypothetical protein
MAWSGAPAPLGLVVREGVLHERDQRWEDGGARGDEGPTYGLRKRTLIAAEVLDKVLRRGRYHGRGVRRIVGMVHHVLLSCVRRAPPGTAMGPCPGRRMDVADVAELSRNASLHTPYHTWLLLPRLSLWHHAIAALLAVHKRAVVHQTRSLRRSSACGVHNPVA